MSVQGPTRFSPASRLGYAELLIRNRIQKIRDRTIEGPRDLGASVIEWVIISAMVVGIAVAVAVILRNKLTGEANNIDVTDQSGGGAP